MTLFQWLLMFPAAVMAVGAVYVYKSWNRWWIAHPRLSNGPKAALVPLTTIIVAYCLAVWPFLTWGMGGHISMYIFLSCTLPFLIVGGFHFAVFLKPHVDKFEMPKNKDEDDKK
jgi:hypothetical protein